MKLFCCGRYQLDLSRPLVMGILNVTPDSFSDGKRFSSKDKAIAQAKRMIKDGAHIIDVGGESTRPQAVAISYQKELSRVLPILEYLRDLNIPISLDTRHTLVMKNVIEANLVDMINDICALEDKGALSLLARVKNIGICLMHMKGTPTFMQYHPRYKNVVEEVSQYLSARIAACQKVGITPERLLADPGFGFGKNFEHNITLLHHLKDLKERVGVPLLVGLSRKSMLGTITGEKRANQRLGAGIAVAIEAVRNGASVIRTHDVKPTYQALAVIQTLTKNGTSSI